MLSKFKRSQFAVFLFRIAIFCVITWPRLRLSFVAVNVKHPDGYEAHQRNLLQEHVRYTSKKQAQEEEEAKNFQVYQNKENTQKTTPSKMFTQKAKKKTWRW